MCGSTCEIRLCLFRLFSGGDLLSVRARRFAIRLHGEVDNQNRISGPTTTSP